MVNMWCQIDSDYFTAAVKLKNDIVIEYDHILTYMLGWTLEEVIEHCKLKGWRYICV